MLLPPPGLLTTESVVGTSFFSLRMRSTCRPVLSLLPPGAEPTTISTLRCGLHVPCAAHTVVAQASAKPITTLNFTATRNFIKCLLVIRFSGVSLLRHARRLDHFHILIGLGADELAEFFGRATHRFLTFVDEALFHILARQDLGDLGVPARHDVPWHLHRCEQAEPGRRLVALESRLVEGWHLRQGRETVQAADPDCTQPPGLD